MQPCRFQLERPALSTCETDGSFSPRQFLHLVAVFREMANCLDFGDPSSTPGVEAGRGMHFST